MLDILLVEDSQFFGSIVRNRLVSDVPARVVWARSVREAVEAMNDESYNFFLAILDLHLPDGMDGQVVEQVSARGLPFVVLTSSSDDDTWDSIWARRPVDYVLKEGAQAIDYLVDLVFRLSINDRVAVLVVDDSAIARLKLCQLLEVQRYRVLQACNGAEALQLLRQHSDVRIMIVDYHMPGMDGLELIRRVRQSHHRKDLAIVGISAHGSGHTSARFLKSGANDYLHKPFITEELYCRVAENVRALDYIRKLDALATQDYLTGLKNRRYFFDVGQKLCANAQRRNLGVGVALLDIDFFKKINDTYGHDGGDAVLRTLSAALASRFRDSDVVARIGGEEFAILTTNMSPGRAFPVFDELRRNLQATKTDFGEHRIMVSVSIGVCTGPEGSLEELLKRADELLYQAKEGGRNRVVCDCGAEGPSHDGGPDATPH